MIIGGWWLYTKELVNGLKQLSRYVNNEGIKVSTLIKDPTVGPHLRPLP